MDSARIDPTVGRTDEQQIDEIVERLQRQYPDQLTQSDLNGRVHGFWRQFDTARVRSYVSILVERMVRRSIEAPPLSHSAVW